MTTETEAPVIETPTTTTEPVVDAPVADPAVATPEADAPTILGGDPAPDPSAGEGEGVGGEAPAGAPEAYELKLTDAEGNDMPLDTELVEQASAVFKELNLDNEQANRLMPMAGELVARTQAAVLNQITEGGAAQRKAWLDEFETSEFGGAKREETTHLAGAALDALGFTKGHEFRTILEETGLGNNVHFISAFAKVGRLVSEDGTFARDTAGADKTPSGWASRYTED